MACVRVVDAGLEGAAPPGAVLKFWEARRRAWKRAGPQARARTALPPPACPLPRHLRLTCASRPISPSLSFPRRASQTTTRACPGTKREQGGGAGRKERPLPARSSHRPCHPSKLPSSCHEMELPAVAYEGLWEALHMAPGLKERAEKKGAEGPWRPRRAALRCAVRRRPPPLPHSRSLSSFLPLGPAAAVRASRPGVWRGASRRRSRWLLPRGPAAWAPGHRCARVGGVWAQ